MKMDYDLKLPRNSYIRNLLRRRLKRRGLILLLDDIAEAHGPHPDTGLKHRIWIVLARDPKDNYEGHVVLYPKKVYWVDSSSDWWKPDEEMEILVAEE